MIYNIKAKYLILLYFYVTYKIICFIKSKIFGNARGREGECAVWLGRELGKNVVRLVRMDKIGPMLLL